MYALWKWKQRTKQKQAQAGHLPPPYLPRLQTEPGRGDKARACVLIDHWLPSLHCTKMEIRQFIHPQTIRNLGKMEQQKNSKTYFERISLSPRTRFDRIWVSSAVISAGTTASMTEFCGKMDRHLGSICLGKKINALHNNGPSADPEAFRPALAHVPGYPHPHQRLRQAQARYTIV